MLLQDNQSSRQQDQGTPVRQGPITRPRNYPPITWEHPSIGQAVATGLGGISKTTALLIILAGLIAGPYTGALVGLMVGLPALIAGELIAMPFAIGCGFAGGGLREACPKETIWQFSPFVLLDLPKHVWMMIRKL